MVAIPSVLFLGTVGFFVGAVISGDTPLPFPFIVPIALNLILGYLLEKRGKQKLGNLVIIGGLIFGLALFAIVLFFPR